MKLSKLVLLFVLFFPLLAFADKQCESQLKVAEAYAAMFGGVVGTIYGVSISQDSTDFCFTELPDGEAFNLIAEKLKVYPHKVGLMPTKQFALKFLMQEFPCKIPE